MTITDRQGNVPEGLGIKAPCSVATTGNITLSGLQTIDGVTLIANQRVLVWQQTDQTTNGIYQASTGNWTRPNDANNNESFIAGTEVIVTSGSTYSGSRFIVACTDDPIIIGTSLLTWRSLSSTSTLAIQKPASAATITIQTIWLETGIDTRSTAVSANLPSIASWVSANGAAALTILDYYGNAASNNITPIPKGADSFQWGGVTPLIESNFGILRLRPDPSASKWLVYQAA